MSDAQINRVVITGAGGFIGRRLHEALSQDGAELVAVSRTSGLNVGDIGASTDWSRALSPGATVVHLAGRAHVLDQRDARDLAVFREVNTAGTRRLALEAARIGVRRLVFVSSIGVLGTSTDGRGPFTTEDPPAPTEPYAQSKAEAEEALWEIAAETGLEVCIIRPPLVYGPGAVGNFRRLMQLARSGIPLPLGSVRNSRSLVALDNLIDLIRICISHPRAAGQTFLVSDGVTISTPDLIRGIAAAMGKRARLVPVPVNLLRLGGRVLGKSAELDRLLGSLEVDITHTRETLGWSPPIDVREGLRRAVQCS
jgi:nucleoside-diphosphate-sugar epimerase